MSTPPEKSDSQNDLAVQLRRICETLLLGFAALIFLAGIIVKEFDSYWTPHREFSTWFFFTAAIFFLLYLRSWFPRVCAHTTLYHSIIEAYGLATDKASPAKDQTPSP